MILRTLLFVGMLLAATQALLAAGTAALHKLPIIGLPCDGCEEVFLRMPEDLSSRTRIGPVDQAGEALIIEGEVRDAAGNPAADVIIYAYHTDADGIYPNANRSRGAHGSRHGDLRGWVKTDAEGRYRFDTIRPASYPRTSIPQHVHMHVIEPGCCTYYIGDIYFDDDPLLRERTRARQAQARGGSGLATPIKDGSGRWQLTRDIVLGERIPGYVEAKGD